ncbi:MaoC family dehydratase [Neptuniibacter caesariensis]|uniref:MaoC-like dehydratase n=1 Tax=Neptuniibacter caesariensis TaxID=207954 RepID=A0A7U8GS35_NEPCE|nr:MaoC family dehydratase [Neptuniibacter caesariensis]EAR60971.1 MaoC-like dehydratase [Oceanospirillum sp. MED92] [Neptuniibacter caesariensis]
MDRYLDDFSVGDKFLAPGFTLSEGQILDYALTYDPQPIHIDALHAAEGPYGGIIASGFQTLSLCFRMMIQTRVFETVSLGGPGLDELRFLAPVRPGDTINTEAEIVSVTQSKSKPDRGVLKIQVSGFNQHKDKVISFIVIMMGRRQ